MKSHERLEKKAHQFWSIYTKYHRGKNHPPPVPMYNRVKHQNKKKIGPFATLSYSVCDFAQSKFSFLLLSSIFSYLPCTNFQTALQIRSRLPCRVWPWPQRPHRPICPCTQLCFAILNHVLPSCNLEIFRQQE
jgi:hypothetical protein